MKKLFWLKLLKRGFLLLVVTCVAYAGLIYCPSVLFSETCEWNGLVLRSDAPIDRSKAVGILKLVNEKMHRSPFYREGDRVGIYVCNEGWRRSLFFALSSRASGLHYYGSSSVFLRGADLHRNLLIGASGRPVEDGRTLDYFICHEITHLISENSVGVLSYHQLPDWIREGYADYIGRGGVISKPECRHAFLVEAPTMNTPIIAPYLRYNLLVSYMLERQEWSAVRLHGDPMNQKDVEFMVRKALLPGRLL